MSFGVGELSFSFVFIVCWFIRWFVAVLFFLSRLLFVVMFLVISDENLIKDDLSKKGFVFIL